MKVDIAELKMFPQHFSYSLEEKIKPTHWQLVRHIFQLPLFEMLKVSDGEFSASLIKMQIQLINDS